MKRQRDEQTRDAWKNQCLGETWYRSTQGFHMVLRLPRASCTLCSFCQGNSRKPTIHRHHHRIKITAVVADWQLPPFPPTPQGLTMVTETLITWGEKKKTGLKMVIICFLLLLYHLRQVRRLCIPNGTSIHAFRVGWFPTCWCEEKITVANQRDGSLW